MDKDTEEKLKHLAVHMARNAAGCVVTLLAMLSGIAVLSAVVVVLFV